MFENVTPETIEISILSQADELKVETREGSFARDIIAPVAVAMCNVYKSLDAIIPMVYVDETSGIYIDKEASKYGMIRKQGIKAQASLIVVGTVGAIIPTNSRFSTAGGLEYYNSCDYEIVSGTNSMTVTAIEIGSKYNVGANKINQLCQTLPGVISVSNPSAADGGTDIETDESLFFRLDERRRHPITSGNSAQYKQWALEVSGVGDAKVNPLANGAGTVGIIIIGADKEPVTSTIASNCQAHIDSVRPIGATVTVTSATALIINVSVTISAKNTANQSFAKLEIERKISDYLKSLAFVENVVVVNEIGKTLLEIDGVTDYSLLKLNNDVANVTIDVGKVAKLGTVIITWT